MPDPPPVASLTILSGALKGTTLVLDEAVEDFYLGSDSGCRLSLDLPGVSPIHARVFIEPQGATVYDTRSPFGVWVNDDRVEGERALRDGDVLWLGAPGGAESVMIQFRHAGAAAAYAPAPAVGPGPAAPDTSAPPPLDDWLIDETDAPAPVAPANDDVSQLLFLDDPVAAVEPDPPVAMSEGDFFFDEPGVPAAPAQAAAPPEFFIEEESKADVFVVEEEGVVVVDPVRQPAPAVKVVAPAPPAPAPSPAPPPPVAAPPPPAAAPPLPVEAPPPPAPRAPRPPPAERRRPPPRPAPPSRRGFPLGLVLGFAALVVAAVGGVLAWRLLSGLRVTGVQPSPARAGDTIAITGRGFAATAADNTVTFGDRPGRVLKAAPERLDVLVPEVPVVPGAPSTRVEIVVQAGGRSSAPVTLVLTAAPRIHGIAPNVAMPGDEVALAGTGWGPGASVRFGELDGAILEIAPSSIRARVPAADGPPGTSLPVVVSFSGMTSNAAPFLLGRLPLVTAVEPSSAAPGDLLLLKGRGFRVQPAGNNVQIGGTRALVVSAQDGEARVVVPRAPAGAVPIEVRVAGYDNVGHAMLQVAAAPDPLALRFVAEPFDDQAGHAHAVLSTDLGAVFVLSAAGGRSAAERAVEAQQRLTQAVAMLAASPAADVELRGLGANPALLLTGSSQPLLEVTAEDAAAYEEDWARAGSRGPAASPARVALWWQAVTRDLVLLLARGERPRHAAQLAPEGRALQELHDAVKRGGGSLTFDALSRLRPATLAGVRSLGTRLPAGVREPAGTAPAGQAAPGAPGATPPSAAAGPLRTDGVWTGIEIEEGERRYISVSFAGVNSNLTYERALSLTVPLIGLEQPQRNAVRFFVRSGNRTRYYVGKWDGVKISGGLFADSAGTTPIGSFELERKK